MTKLIYISSPSYSGSTLLTLMLAQHPDIGTIAEMKGTKKDWETYQCSCGDLLRDCSFWKELISRLKADGFDYDISNLKTMPVFHQSNSELNNMVLRRDFGPWWIELLRNVWIALNHMCKKYLERQQEYNRVFIQHVLDMTGKIVFLDSSKDPIRLKYLTNDPSLEVFVIQLIRDGRAVVNSHRKNVGMSIKMASYEWLNTHIEIERAAKQFTGGRLLQIRYEDLCQEPKKNTKKIFAFAGLSTNPDITFVDGSKCHVRGNKMRLKGFQMVKHDTTWKKEMKKEEIIEFERIAGAKNRNFGYLKN